MSQGNHDFYSHLPNCGEVCAAGCPNAIFKHGWEASEQEQEKQRKEDARLSEELFQRAKLEPSLFVLRIIGHLDGLWIAGEITSWHHAMSTGKLWEIYLNTPQRWGGGNGRLEV